MAARKSAESSANSDAETASKEITLIPDLTSEDYRNLQSWDDVNALLHDHFQDQVADADDELGDGFVLLRNKSRLENAPMVLLNWQFHESDKFERVVDGEIQNGKFVAARVVANTVHGFKKYILIDGGTGIYEQLRDYSARTNAYGPMKLKNGLRVSEYEYEDEKGQKSEASTWYLNTQAEE